ncbi:flagellar basal body-associated protein FliL [Alkalilimnicola sp. S0819]|uniref:flagellar basal body-associated FliL family protein n=1 Tax=Alkalilimnicola sp. S0819 TaxID=2613922 RepID=UPI001262623E|nr:flagellar basal body-associated FliL family protein [Alkalilimnicola sp. S0819]KAB7627176.1 flagellar basal body protein FliL [Alkalilimnicola sp. S0819]MPQ15888.1 flagellar basal body protein FliL [Alkalilimnicola sp. S0819]
MAYRGMKSIALPARQQGLTRLMIVLILLVVLLLGSGVTLALYMTGVVGGLGGEQELAEGEGEEIEEEVATEPLLEPQYMPLEPALVVNFERNGRLGYLQVNMQLMVRGSEAMNNVLEHMPVIRDAMLMLLSSQTYEDVRTREGKEALRAQAVAEANRVLEEKQVEDRVEAVYFTGFVMQ